MALPASPPITMAQICAEFGAPANTPLSAFLRGGAWVPNTPTNAGVPASLPISMLQLLGAAATIPTAIAISNQTANATGLVGSGTKTSIYSLLNTGVCNIQGNFSSNVTGEWKTGPDAASLYEARWTPISGSPSGAAVNTWLNLGTSRQWSASRTVAGVTSVSGTVEIRPAGGGAVIDSATITLYCELSN